MGVPCLLLMPHSLLGDYDPSIPTPGIPLTMKVSLPTANAQKVVNDVDSSRSANASFRRSDWEAGRWVFRAAPVHASSTVGVLSPR
jgi:hypothetical protein